MTLRLTWLAAGLALALAAAPSSAQTPKAPVTALPPGAIELTLVEIKDPSKGVTAARALVPAGWTSTGGVQWNQGQCVEMASFIWQAVSPDGLSNVEMFQNPSWAANNSGIASPCPWGEYANIQSFLAAYLKYRYPTATPTSFKPRPDLLDVQRDQIDAKARMVAMLGPNYRAYGDAGELLYSDTVNGKPVDGVISATGMFYTSQQYNPLGGPPLMAINGGTLSNFGARAPKGQLDLKTVEAIRKSVKPDLKWSKEYMDLMLAKGAIDVQNTRDTTAIIVANGAALTAATIARNEAAVAAGAKRLAENHNAVYADPAPSSSGAADDRSQRERIESIRGVETYDDPVYGGQVQLDNTYDHAWRVQNSDSYILTNDPNFNPGQFNIDAVQLKTAR